MENNKNYIGKILKVYFEYNGQERSQTGIVFDQEKTSRGFRFSMLLTSGQEWTSPTSDSLIKITSARLEPALREALTGYCKAKIAQQEFLKSFWKEKAAHENNVSSALKMVKERSDVLSHSDFCNAVEDMFCNVFPSADKQHRDLSVRCTSTSADSFVISHIFKYEKYIKPENYPFVYREYDDNLFVDDSVKGYHAFCLKNAPLVVVSMKGKKVDVSTSAFLGDKNTLYVSRDYTFPLKYGRTKKSLTHIKETFIDAPVKKSSLADQMKSASSRTDSSRKSTIPKSKEPGQDR